MNLLLSNFSRKQSPNTMKNFLCLLCLLFVQITFNACHKDDPIPTDPVVTPTPVIPVPVTPIFPPILIPPTNPPTSWSSTIVDSSAGNGMICVEKDIVWGPQYEEILCLNPHGDVIYPGAVFQYESFQDGSYQPIVGDRKPITISASLQGSSSPLNAVIQEPSLSAVRESIETILNPFDGTTVADALWNEREIYSEEHFKLAIGANFGTLKFNIAAGFEFNNTEIRSRYLLEFTQVYYSIDMDTPMPGLENWFEKELDNQDQIGEYSPVYVSSVRYGRKVFLLIESKSLSYDQLANVEASFKIFKGSGGVTVDQTLSKLIEEKSVKAIIMGGSAASAIAVISDFSQLKNYLEEGANFSKQSPGVPLAYTLRFIKNNAIAKLQFLDHFTIRECYPNTAEIEVPDQTFLYPEHIAGDAEFNGNGPKIEAKAWLEVKNNNKEIWLNVSMHSIENGGDLTEGVLQHQYLLYVAPGNRKILSISSDNYSEWLYEDDDDAMDSNELGGDELVRKFEIMGDTAGEDLGAKDTDHSFISVYLNPVKVKLQ